MARPFFAGCIGRSSPERSMQADKWLSQARQLYDDPNRPFAMAARSGWRTGFASGTDWMRLVMGDLRGVSIPPVCASYNMLGLVKYGLASTAALAYISLVVWLHLWLF